MKVFQFATLVVLAGLSLWTGKTIEFSVFFTGALILSAIHLRR